MRKLSKILLITVVTAQLATIGVRAAVYQLDNNTPNFPLNASDGTEPLDNWFGNVFTAVAGGNLINRVDVAIYTVTAGSTATLSLYRVTDPGGNPALGATRVYNQVFTPAPGGGSTVNLNHITLTTPYAFNVGDRFLVSIFMANVIAAPPNDVYPYVIDNGTSSAGSYWDRSAPNTFNLDNLSGCLTVDQALAPGGFVPGPGHMIIRANGIEVPEPSALSLAGLGVGLLMMLQRRRS